MKIDNETAIDEGESRSNYSSTGPGYMVEARYNYARPITVFGVPFDSRWRELPLTFSEEAKFPGIPRPALLSDNLRDSRLLTYEEAEAHRWMFICLAEANDRRGSLCFETRLIEYQIEVTRKVTPTRIINARDFRGDLPKDPPKPNPQRP